MKKYLFIALALLGMASCAKDDLGNGKKPHHNGEVEESYIAINLMAADVDSRAAEDEFGYEDGTDAERAVKTAYFFFFDENGNPFNVVNAPATAPGGGKNHLPLTITPMTEEGETMNVSDISNAVLILNTYKGVYPKQVVAVLNWVPEKDTYSLSDLHANLTNLVGVDDDDAKGGYVMSNSVYMDGANKLVDAVSINEDDIKKTQQEALDAPIEIYVERIAAKVVVTAPGKVADTANIFNTQRSSDLFGAEGESTTTPVYVQLLGWELFNDYKQSHLLKNIDTAWGDLGFNWNDYNFYRCYWAESQNTAINDSFFWQYTQDNQTAKGFKTEYGFAVANAADYTDATTYTYCGENTNGTNTDLRTKVILKGQLMQSDGNGGYKSLELASWYGNEYAGVDNLLVAVANSLAYTLFYSEQVEGTTKYYSITEDDIMCDVNVAGTQSFETGFTLSAKGKTKLWYKYSSDGNHTALGSVDDLATNNAATNTYLADNVNPAIVYTNGMTYYIVDVEHLGATGKTAEYGVVRNHVYQININSIGGYGSPIYSGTDFEVTEPDYPAEYEDSYVAAKINVLSWKVVKQEVAIQPQN